MTVRAAAVRAAAVHALGVDPVGRVAYALTFPLRWGWEAAVFWVGVLVAVVWHLAARHRHADAAPATRPRSVRPHFTRTETDEEIRP